MVQNEITVNVQKDVGESPLINFLIDLNIQMSNQNMQFFFDHITEDIRWHIIGLQTLKGKEKVIEFMEEVGNLPVKELFIQSIISHGTAGAVNAAVTLSNHEKCEYCSVYTFTNDEQNIQIKEITTYFQKYIEIIDM